MDRRVVVVPVDIIQTLLTRLDEAEWLARVRNDSGTEGAWHAITALRKFAEAIVPEAGGQMFRTCQPLEMALAELLKGAKPHAIIEPSLAPNAETDANGAKIRRAPKAHDPYQIQLFEATCAAAVVIFTDAGSTQTAALKKVQTEYVEPVLAQLTHVKQSGSARTWYEKVRDEAGRDCHAPPSEGLRGKKYASMLAEWRTARAQNTSAQDYVDSCMRFVRDTHLVPLMRGF